MSETWKECIGFHEYEVSDTGKVRNQETKLILKQQTQNSGYRLVHLRKNKKRYAVTVHRLVLFAFVGSSNGKHCDHKNGNKTDNRLENLHWVTPAENMKNQTTRQRMRDHSAKNFQGCFGSKHPKSRKVYCPELDRVFGSMMEAERITGIDRASIGHACRGRKQKTAGGYQWIYANKGGSNVSQ